MTIQLLTFLLTWIGCLTSEFRPSQMQLLNGTWRLNGAPGTIVLLTVADNYLIQSTYEPTRFVATRGGPYQQTGNTINLQVEFDTADSSRVGQTELHPITLRGTQLILGSPDQNQTFDRVDETPTSLTGLWRITGRANEAGQLTDMQRGPRKTIKLLTGSRFQWVAINPQTRQFFGTGGGTYTLTNGQYTETIDFFSRDNSRVGHSLTFAATVSQDEWLHRGQSSTGNPVSERWSRERAESATNH